MTFYDRLQGTAERLIARFGAAAILSKPGAMGGDTWNPTPGTATTSTVRAVDITESERDRDETLVASQRKRFLVSTAGLAPARGDSLDGARIEEVRPLNPGGTVLLYEVEVASG